MINEIEKDVYRYVNQELDKIEEEFNIKKKELLGL